MERDENPRAEAYLDHVPREAYLVFRKERCGHRFSVPRFTRYERRRMKQRMGCVGMPTGRRLRRKSP